MPIRIRARPGAGTSATAPGGSSSDPGATAPGDVSPGARPCSGPAAPPLVAAALLAPAGLSQSFVNFESAHVHPLELTPDGTRLLAVNTPDNRLQVFDVSGAGVVSLGAVPVGLDPVSVRARSNTEAW